VSDVSELPQGTLEMLVLKALSLAPMHGWGVGHRIDQLSKDVFKVQQGSLYPALQRMIRKGLIRSEWRTSDNNRRARYYAITKAGHKQLNENAAAWRRVTSAVDAIMSAKLADAT
jgi:PadR family transcriptional regulator, regulatory protein PadR